MVMLGLFLGFLAGAWVYNDAKERGSSGAGCLWAIFVALLLFPFFPLYFLFRPSRKNVMIPSVQSYPPAQQYPQPLQNSLTKGQKYVTAAEELSKDIVSTNLDDYFSILSLYAKALEAGYDKPYILYRYAEILEKCGDKQGALDRYLEAYRENDAVVSWRKIQELANSLGVKVEL